MKSLLLGNQPTSGASLSLYLTWKQSLKYTFEKETYTTEAKTAEAVSSFQLLGTKPRAASETST
jgi:hypothetical protein